MWDKPDDQRIIARALLGDVCLVAAILLVFLGFFLPTHDYAGLGDPVLDSIVSDDARDVTAMLATMSVLLAGAGLVVIRSRGLVVVSAVVFHNFDAVFTLTAGAFGTANLPYAIYRTFFQAQEYGVGSAMAVVTIAGTMVIMSIFWR